MIFRDHDFNFTQASDNGAPPPPESGLTGECWCIKEYPKSNRLTIPKNPDYWPEGSEL